MQLLTLLAIAFAIAAGAFALQNNSPVVVNLFSGASKARWPWCCWPVWRWAP